MKPSLKMLKESYKRRIVNCYDDSVKASKILDDYSGEINQEMMNALEKLYLKRQKFGARHAVEGLEAYLYPSSSSDARGFLRPVNTSGFSYFNDNERH